MKGDASNELNIVVALPNHSPGGFSDDGKGFWKKVIQSLTVH